MANILHRPSIYLAVGLTSGKPSVSWTLEALLSVASQAGQPRRHRQMLARAASSGEPSKPNWDDDDHYHDASVQPYVFMALNGLSGCILFLYAFIIITSATWWIWPLRSVRRPGRWPTATAIKRDVCWLLWHAFESMAAGPQPSICPFDMMMIMVMSHQARAQPTTGHGPTHDSHTTARARPPV